MYYASLRTHKSGRTRPHPREENKLSSTFVLYLTDLAGVEHVSQSVNITVIAYAETPTTQFWHTEALRKIIVER